MGVVIVAKKKKSEEGAEQKRPNRSAHAPIHARIAPQVDAAFRAWIESHTPKIKVKDALDYALAEFLRSVGYDPANYLPGEEED